MDSRRSKPITAREIAENLHLSKATVSLVLNGKGGEYRIPERTAERILTAARECNYRPNLVARQLAGKRSNAVGVLISTEAIADVRLTQAMEILAAQRGIRFMVGHAVGTREGVLSYLDDFRSRGVDAVISIFHNHPDYSSIVEPELLKFKNVVFFERPTHWTDGGPGGHCYVDLDFHHVGYAGTSHLLGRGRRRIAEVFSNSTFPYAVERHRGYCDALQGAGIAVDPRLVWILPERTSARWADTFAPQLARQAIEDLVVRQGADAIVAVNDSYAARLMAALRQRGLRVPEDVALIGSDNLEVGVLADPPITTFDNRLDDAAAAMIQLLFGLLENGTIPADQRAIVIPPELTVRASS